MSRRKAHDTSGQPATKRACPAFRVAQVPTTSESTTQTTGSRQVCRTSRVSTIKKNARGRRGYLTEDKVHSESQSIDDAPPTPTQTDQLEQPAADRIVLDSPLLSDISPLDDPDYGQLDDPAPDPAASIQRPKPKRIQKNTTSVSLHISYIL
jgi:hypothetical protein